MHLALTTLSAITIICYSGNTAIKQNNYDGAVDNYSLAISEDPTNGVYYSNRSYAYWCLKKYELALADAEKCCELKPDWARGFERKGSALKVRLGLPSVWCLPLFDTHRRFFLMIRPLNVTTTRSRLMRKSRLSKILQSTQRLTSF